MQPVKVTISWRSGASRGALFALIWWALTDGAVAAWWIGAPAVLLAVAVSVALVPPSSLIWYEVVRFAPIFFLRSLQGGVDVAWRAFHPRLPIHPDIIEYPLRLPPGPSRVFMANTISLLPGTLSVELGAVSLTVHVLDRHKDFLTELEAVEHSVARMFGASLTVSEGGG